MRSVSFRGCLFLLLIILFRLRQRDSAAISMAKEIDEVAKEWDEWAEGWTTGEMGEMVLQFNRLAEEIVRSKAHCCDLLVECPFSPNSLDLIISGSVLTFTPDLPKTLAKLADLSKPGGYQLHFVFKGPDAPVRDRSRTTELSYEDGMSEAQLRDELEAAQLSCLESGELPPLSATESMTWIWVLAKK
ncbi:unnamed protein product [Durusdinium trenchii]|uniref:Methyltransferase type 11 domain-containing protein n=1 Tax=Durusdinium trenchii TaxID=1381693 RepID=A0ABP0Q161_9DINO